MCDDFACGRPKRKSRELTDMKLANSMLGDMMGEVHMGMLKPSKSLKPKTHVLAGDFGQHAVVTVGRDLYDPNDFVGLEINDGSTRKKMRGWPNSLVEGAHLFNRPLLERVECLQVTEDGNCAGIANRIMEVLRKDAAAGGRYMKSVGKLDFSSPSWRMPNFDELIEDAGRHASGSGAGGGSVTSGGIENVESGV